MNYILPSYPPAINHQTQPLSLDSALRNVDRYIASLRTAPHHHPDALITPAGVTFHPSSGPTGNLQIANLRRIASGLRGENLGPSPDDLLALELMAREEGGVKRKAADEEEDTFVFDGDVLRKRLKEGVGLSGIGPSRQRGLEKSDGTPVRGVLKKRKLEDGLDKGGSQESVSGGALKRRDERRGNATKMETVEEKEGEKPDEEMMDLDEWREKQDIVEGEVADRHGAPVISQEVVEPEVRETVANGRGGIEIKGEDDMSGKTQLSEEQKARRREEKKKRIKAQKMERERKRTRGE
ncbi:Midasin [Sphaceloma murrayae]|uniref:Midasin n=1 Tax=Sphaceloma murrayae TaxID=2082308 RepID=A0A2K1QRQ4_9PEZI|nr:Midasin [Sphaceloma murrayae]